MSKREEYGWGSQLVVAVVFAALGLGLLYWFVTWAEPAERTHRQTFQERHSEAAWLAALTTNRLSEQVANITALGTRPGEREQGRYTGSPGFYRTENLIIQKFHEYGLAVTTQELQVTVAVTEYCEILDETGRPLEGVTLYPFLPAGLEPTVLPPEGIRGDLVFTESADMKYLSGHAPTNTIVLTYLDAARDWTSLAGIGVQAIIVREDELALRLRDSRDKAGPWPDLTSKDEVTFPRFVARGPIERWAGQPVTVRCKVTWQPRKVRNVFGLLRGENPMREALIVSAFYDSNSLVPELAPGAEQSLSLALLLEYARAFTAYRGQLQRDILFVATAGHAQAMAGASRLMEAIETVTRQQSDYQTLEERRREQEHLRDSARHALEIVDELTQGAAQPLNQRADAFPRQRWLREDPAFRRWFEQNLAVITGEIDLDNQELTRLAKLAYQRAGSPAFRFGFDPGKATEDERRSDANTHPLLTAYIKARMTANDSANLMSVPIWKIVSDPNFSAWACTEKARARFLELIAHHEQQIREYDDLLAVRRLFEPYENTLTIGLELYSGGENWDKKRENKNLASLVGISQLGAMVEPQSSELAKAISDKVPRVGNKPAWDVLSWGGNDAAGASGSSGISGMHTELESEVWHCCGRQAFTVTTHSFFPPKACTPEDTMDGVALDLLYEQAPVVGRALLSIGCGRIPFKSIPPTRDRITSIRGSVFASAGSGSLVPSHPVTIRTFAHAFSSTRPDLPLTSRGVEMHPVIAVDPYGVYERRIVLEISRSTPFSVNAARFDDQGRIVYFKDTSVTSQGIYRNVGLYGNEVLAGGSQPPKAVNVPVFRCRGVSLFDRGNPRTLKSFQAASYLDRQGLSGPARSYRSTYTDFMEPDFRFYVGFMDGAAGNKEILQYRAFMLNVDPMATNSLANESELFGRGYLVADTPNLSIPHMDAAASMIHTGEKRLELQKRYAMADEQMLSFHERSKEWLADARNQLAANEPMKAVIAAGTSLAYAINNHPVIRDRISQAVIGILWYLGLLVPFVFFAEKLLFGFADIRRQLLANGVIFVLVFALLRLFHPAFQMVRSSVVILLGFIIFMLTVLVTLMVSSKFKQNIKDLRNREGRVEGADINRAGVVGTAFMLGLNNMRRRKVRTGLTCVTLVLITFVMICFTSVSTDLKNVEYPTGRSDWNGIMLRNPNFRALDNAELANLRRIYGNRFPITVWKWMVSKLTVNRLGSAIANPNIVIDREFLAGNIRSAKRATVNGCVAMEWNEPLFTGIDRYLLTTRGWFPTPPQTREERQQAAAKGYKDKNFVMLPDSVAAELGVTLEDVNTGHPLVLIRDAEFEVLGIVDTERMGRALGLDGRSILPYDLNSVQNMGRRADDLVVPEDAARLSPQQVIIVNRMPPVDDQLDVSIACCILFPKAPYRLDSSSPELPPADIKEQRRTVLEYLERIGEPAFYAVDGISYYGSRQRAKTFKGLLELLVPILIAALTVFNTMRGSVYERKDEIYVYNAVGVAPNHVFFIFMAEACVYAVVGALMGYLLSQGTGRLLTALNLTGGLNMDYSSIETIYASLAIMAATLFSTILPARDAARMASPAGSVTWTLPEAQGDTMRFHLPFTFTVHDRIAVISYFHRWLDANGVGSSGPFYCSVPEPSIADETDGPRGPEAVPTLTATIWLKPYDLGVSQRVVISLPTDPETGEYIARIAITRLSGHVTTWQRTVKPFLGTLRKQFLNWRVTTPTDRTEMFAEAKRLLMAGPTTTVGKET